MAVDLDKSLRLLAQTWPSRDLHGFEEDVLATIRAGEQQPVKGGVGLTMVSVALLMGIAGAALPSSHVNAATVVPFGTPHRLAPSSLLLGDHA